MILWQFRGRSTLGLGGSEGGPGCDRSAIARTRRSSLPNGKAVHVMASTSR